MTVTKEQHGTYLSVFQQQQSSLNAVGPSWVESIRKAAIHRFAELGFPTTKNEEWKYTNVSPLARTAFELAGVRKREPGDASPQTLPLGDLDCVRLVFVDGAHFPGLSSSGTLPAGVKVGNLARSLAGDQPSLEAHLARYAAFEDHAFVALNTAFMEDGAVIEVGKDVVLDRPIHLVYISTGDGQRTVTHPRNLILVGRGSQVNIIEAYVGLRSEFPISNFQFLVSKPKVAAYISPTPLPRL